MTYDWLRCIDANHGTTAHPTDVRIAFTTFPNTTEVCYKIQTDSFRHLDCRPEPDEFYEDMIVDEWAALEDDLVGLLLHHEYDYDEQAIEASPLTDLLPLWTDTSKPDGGYVAEAWHLAKSHGLDLLADSLVDAAKCIALNGPVSMPCGPTLLSNIKQLVRTRAANKWTFRQICARSETNSTLWWVHESRHKDETIPVFPVTRDRDVRFTVTGEEPPIPHGQSGSPIAGELDSVRPDKARIVYSRQPSLLEVA
ncbi:hypothetical protein Q5752_006144 [Cryptotrichosporon argae]